MSNQRGAVAEQKVFEYVKLYIDPKAEKFGGMDSTTPDIILSNGEIIEVKQCVAQCGQFTMNTAVNYKYSDKIIKSFGKKPVNNQVVNDSDLCALWIKDYYLNNKNVSWFGVYYPTTDVVQIFSPDEFFTKAVFKCTYRAKPSGTSTSTPKWAYKYIPEEWDCIQNGNYMVAQNKNAYDQYVMGCNTKGDLKRIWVNPEGKVKIKSDTASNTYIFSLSI